MTELIRLLMEILTKIFPLRLVSRWEHGVWYVWGWHWKTVHPGIYPILPFIMDIRPVSVVPTIFCTPLQTITLRDGRALTFSATITVQVEDAAKAFNAVDQWHETTLELVSGLLSEQLADVQPERFDPARGKRDRLLEELREEADKATADFGVRVKAIRFSNFAVGVRTVRLLAERATLADDGKPVGGLVG